MIAKIKYSTFKDMSFTQDVDTQRMSLIAGYDGAAPKECPIMISCTSGELADVLSKVNKNNNIVGYYIVGDCNFDELTSALTTYDTDRVLNVLVPYMFTGENDTNLNQALKYFTETAVLNKHMRVLIKLPDDYSNMQYVKTMCETYPIVRFTGGMLIALLGCRIGVIENEDLPRQINESKLPIIYEGEQSVDIMVDYLDMENISWKNKTLPKESKPKAPKEPKEPKAPKEPKPKIEKVTKKSVIASKFAVVLDDDEF